MTGLNALHQLKGNGIWAVKFMERDINGKEFLFGIYQYEPQTGHVTELGQTDYVLTKNNIVDVKINGLTKSITLTAAFPYAFAENKNANTINLDDVKVFTFA